jgi:hypothetical protein
MLASQADEGIVVVDLPEFVQMSRDAKKD